MRRPQMNSTSEVSTRMYFLLRMLATALGRDVADRAFQNLQQRLLHAFAGKRRA